MKWNQSWSTNQQRLVFASVWELQVTHFSVRFTFSTFSPLFYSSFTLFFFSHSLTLFDVLSLLSFLTHRGFSISLVHDGELTRTSLSEAWSQTVTQVGVWLFISHLLIAAHPHTHTHTLTPTRFPKGARVVAPPVIWQPIKTWFCVPEERGWHVICSSIRSQCSVCFSAQAASNKLQGCS